MAVTIALFIRVRHASIRRKPEKNVYKFGIQSFLSFHFEFRSKIRNSQVTSRSIQLRISAAFVNFDKAYLLNH
jgi:hypothetical protein